MKQTVHFYQRGQTENHQTTSEQQFGGLMVESLVLLLWEGLTRTGEKNKTFSGLCASFNVLRQLKLN